MREHNPTATTGAESATMTADQPVASRTAGLRTPPATNLGEEPETGAGSVQLSGIRKSFGDAVAIDNLNLEVEAGEFISLLGPSGCGKTTLLRMIAGFENPDSGDIQIGGTSVLGAAPNKRPVNTVFQSYALFPHMSVAENVGYGLRQRRVPRAHISERVMSALRLSRMDSFADRKPSTLSGGQQQRVALARALVNRPKVLLLDEPMSALDRKLREEMQLELTVMQNELGITFIFVTHDQEEALTMSDRVAVMNQGRIQQLDSAQEVYASPTNLFVAEFIGKRNFLPVSAEADGSVTGTGFTLTPGATLVDASAGERNAMLAVRAEDIDVYASQPEPDRRHRLQAQIVDISHPGEVTQYLLTAPGGERILVRTPRARSTDLDFGQHVTCVWDPVNSQVFSAQDRRSEP